MREKVKRLITAVTDLKEFQRLERRSFFREGTFLETLGFFEICHSSYQLFTFLPCEYLVPRSASALVNCLFSFSTG